MKRRTSAVWFTRLRAGFGNATRVRRSAAACAPQGLDELQRTLLTLFCPPKSDCLLARFDGAAGRVVIAMPNADGICGMNRMYVRDSARGRGAGRALVAELPETARPLGVRRMLLAAGPLHTKALRLHESLGFVVDEHLPDAGAGDVESRMIRDP